MKPKILSGVRLIRLAADLRRRDREGENITEEERAVIDMTADSFDEDEDE